MYCWSGFPYNDFLSPPLCFMLSLCFCISVMRFKGSLQCQISVIEQMSRTVRKIYPRLEKGKSYIYKNTFLFFYMSVIVRKCPRFIKMIVFYSPLLLIWWWKTMDRKRKFISNGLRRHAVLIILHFIFFHSFSLTSVFLIFPFVIRKWINDSKMIW